METKGKNYVPESDYKRMIVIYFNDDYINVMAERFKIKAKFNKNCMLEYKCYANQKFSSFDPPTMQFIMRKAF